MYIGNKFMLQIRSKFQPISARGTAPTCRRVVETSSFFCFLRLDEEIHIYIHNLTSRLSVCAVEYFGNNFIAYQGNWWVPLQQRYTSSHDYMHTVRNRMNRPPKVTWFTLVSARRIRTSDLSLSGWLLYHWASAAGTARRIGLIGTETAKPQRDCEPASRSLVQLPNYFSHS